MLSFTEENYLKAIFSLQEKTSEKISTTALSRIVDTKAATVTDMLKKLSVKKLIHYKKYQGVVLTETGKKHALSVIRKHRLWELFLVKTLSFKWDEVHEIAEQLEHIRSEELVNRLEKFLNYPTADPHGDPIPAKNGKLPKHNSIPLSNAPTGFIFTFSGVADHSPDFLSLLNKIGLSIGGKFKLMSKAAYDNSCTVQFQKKNIVLSDKIAQNILVKK